MEDLKAFLRSKVPEDRLDFNWTDERDEGKKYPVDFRVNHMKRPLFIYGLPNEDYVKDAAPSSAGSLKFQSAGISRRSTLNFP